MVMKRQSYTTSEKLKIIQFAEEQGNQAAQREFTQRVFTYHSPTIIMSNSCNSFKLTYCQNLKVC